ncbi:hypothetical protein I312_101506 [Cryptococcus bacillisporus CA1280]|uniref:uncharacterized protein n=1 Tax=Cryptococcus bacillisporus CA1280 TaxID=1296109 RepID=UPI003365BC1B
MPNVAQHQRSSGTTASAGIVGNSSISDRARRRRHREASPEPHQQLHELEEQPALRRTRHGKLHDACIECRRTIPPSRIPFTDNVDTLIPQHAIDCIKTFQSECEKITVDTCITCDERWFDLDVSREGRCKPLQILVFTEDKVSKFKEHLSDCNAWQTRKTWELGRDKILYGRIHNIEPSTEGDLGTVTINSSTIGRVRHSIHGVPMIRGNEGQNITLLSHAVHFASQ